MAKNIEDRKILERWIRGDYKKVQSYLKGNPGVEGFIDSLGILEEDIGTYLFETLKIKKYGKDPHNTNTYEKYMKGGKDRQYIESLILNKVLGKKISIDSLVDDGLTRIKELFSTTKALEIALKKGLIQNISINDVILPPDPKDIPEIGNGTGFEKRELEQDKFLLFMSMLRKLGIYDDDILIIHSGILNDNMMRQNTYYAIYIPRINKTVFLNIGYGEASFVCDGKVSIEIMTTYGKEKLQNELGAIKIIFFEKNIQGWENNLIKALLGKGGEVGEKVDIKEIKKNFEKKCKFNDFRGFFNEHKNDTFKDFEGKKVLFEYLFSSKEYYNKNYKLAIKYFGIRLPCESISFGFPKWNDLKQGLGLDVKEDIISFEEFKEFFKEHKNDIFVDSEKNEVSLDYLFSGQDYYMHNYKLANQYLGICLPSYVDIWKMGFNEVKKKLGFKIVMKNREDIIPFEEFKDFFAIHKNDLFLDHEGNTVPLEYLFGSQFDYYIHNYRLVNQEFGLDLPSHISSWNLTWNELKQELGSKILKSNISKEDIISIDDFIEYINKNKNKTFIDYKGDTVVLTKLFSSTTYYSKNYKLFGQQLGMTLPSHIPCNIPSWNLTWNELKKKLKLGRIKETQKNLLSFQELVDFYNKYKEDILIVSLFVNKKYYKANYKTVNKKYGTHLPHNLTQTYGKTFNEIKKLLGIDSINEKQESIMTWDELKDFFAEHKEDTFLDLDGVETPVRNLFNGIEYYRDNYKMVNRKYLINLPSNIEGRYGITRNGVKKQLGLDVKKAAMSIEEIQDFFKQHKDDTFVDSEGKVALISDLFSSTIKYYYNNYKKVNKEYEIALPSGIGNRWKNFKNEIKQKHQS